MESELVALLEKQNALVFENDLFVAGVDCVSTLALTDPIDLVDVGLPLLKAKALVRAANAPQKEESPEKSLEKSPVKVPSIAIAIASPNLDEVDLTEERRIGANFDTTEERKDWSEFLPGDDPLDLHFNYSKMRNDKIPSLPQVAPDPQSETIRWQQFKRLEYQIRENRPRSRSPSVSTSPVSSPAMSPRSSVATSPRSIRLRGLGSSRSDVSLRRSPRPLDRENERKNHELLGLPPPPSALCDCHGEEICPDAPPPARSPRNSMSLSKKVSTARKTISRSLSKGLSSSPPSEAKK